MQNHGLMNMWFDRFKNPPATIKTGFKKMDSVIGALIPGMHVPVGG